MHVADHVERAGEVAAVVEGAGPDDARLVDLVVPVQHVDGPEPFAPEAAQPAPQAVVLAADHLGAEGAVGPLGVPDDGGALRHVEDDRDRQHVVLAGQLDELPAVLRLHVRRVDHGQPTGTEPQGGDVAQQRERLRRHGLVVLVVREQSAAEVGGEHLGGREVPSGEGRFARPADADQHHQAQLRDPQPAHAAIRSNTAICVGAPRSASGTPIGSTRTV